MLQRLRASPLRYHLFILTVWEEDRQPVGASVWRYRLEESRTGEQKGFKTLAELTAYLTEWVQRPNGG